MPPAFEVLLLNTAVPQIQAAQAGDTYVVPRDIAFSAALTLSAGTANGVPYLNGSKVLTTGSALTFDGTNFATTGASTGLRLIASSTDASGSVLQVDTTATAFGRVGGSTTMGYVAGTQSLWAIGGTEQMRLTSTGLGIGTSSPGAKLDVADATQATGAIMRLTNSASSSAWVAGDVIGQIDFYSTDASLAGTKAQIKSFADTGTSSVGINYSALSFSTMLNGTFAERMRLDSSGNLGLGVVPSAWGSGNRFLDVNLSASYGAFGSTDTMMLANAYWNGSAWIRKNNNNAFRFVIESVSSSPTMTWQVAANSTAGSTISWTQAMTLDASGRLLVGGTTSSSSEFRGEFFSGSATSPIAINVGRTGVDTLIGTAGATNNFVTGTAQGDSVIRSAANLWLGSNGASNILFYTNGASERARITSGGDFQTSSGNSVMVGGTAARATTAGTNRVDIFDGTAPVGTLANGVSFYSASGEANVMDAAGNATLLSPHDAVTNEWIFRSKHTPTGKVLKIDVERLLKFVNDHFGLDAVHEFIED